MTIIVSAEVLAEWEEAFTTLSTPKSPRPIPKKEFTFGIRPSVLHTPASDTLLATPETLAALYSVKAGLGTEEGIEIYSAYRNPKSQFKLWVARVEDIRQRNTMFSLEECVEQAAQYTASPHHPGLPPHMRGDALDVGLLVNGHRALMATDTQDYEQMRFDYFASTNPTIQSNRQRLRELMALGGFIPYEKEYWHFGLTPAFLS